ncbi:MAG: hypothetical protein NXY57DRAFT_904603 [Lentinula lateritia]|nr:MAG: hypothetical protein NXY57DRAFT_904603 [Lentinula lateritia]
MCHQLQTHQFHHTMFNQLDAYHRGLSGKQAAWAGKMYHGHYVLPDSIMKDIEVTNLQ